MVTWQVFISLLKKEQSRKNPRQSVGSENRAFISSVSAAMLAHCSEVLLFQMQQRMCVFPEAGTVTYCSPGYAIVTERRKCVEYYLDRGIDLWAAVGAPGVQTEG